MRKFEQPDELGAYDRYELKLGKKTSSQTSPLVKEWADAVLFANYKTFAVMADDKGKKFKAQGGMRTMYTEHHPCWDAKNRWGLKPEVPFDFAENSSVHTRNGKRTCLYKFRKTGNAGEEFYAGAGKDRTEYSAETEYS